MNAEVQFGLDHDIEQPSVWGRTFRALHLIEKIYAIVVFGISALQITRGDSDVLNFLLLWAALALVSVLAALWPRTPRIAALFAEAFLTLLVVGHWVAANPHWLPALNRCQVVSENVPLVERRLIAWNMIGGLFFAWASVPCGALIMNRVNGFSWKGIIGFVGIVVVSLLLLFLVAIFAFGVVLGWS